MSDWVRVPKGKFLDCEACGERYWGADAGNYLREFEGSCEEFEILCTQCIRARTKEESQASKDFTEVIMRIEQRKREEKKMSRTYPRWFSIETPDGEGEATKQAQGEAWNINFPTGGLSIYGSVEDAGTEIRKHLKHYPKGELKIGPVIQGTPPSHIEESQASDE